MQDVFDGSPTDLISPRQLAQALGKKPATLAAWRTHGDGPPFIKVGQAVYYQRRDVVEWLESRKVSSAAAGMVLNRHNPGSRAQTVTPHEG